MKKIYISGKSFYVLRFISGFTEIDREKKL